MIALRMCICTFLAHSFLIIISIFNIILKIICYIKNKTVTMIGSIRTWCTTIIIWILAIILNLAPYTIIILRMLICTCSTHSFLAFILIFNKYRNIFITKLISQLAASWYQPYCSWKSQYSFGTSAEFPQ